jgi:hypothetical protein
MDPQHAQMVRQDLRRPRNAIIENGPRYRKLTMMAIRCVYLHLSDGTPLALPGTAGAVYLDDPSAVALHDCEDCGYRVPVGYPDANADPPKPPRIYFQRCPLCSGKVGYCAFYKRNGSTAARSEGRPVA